jgi:hypothetical protein
VDGETNPDHVLFQQQVAGDLNSYTLENRFLRKDGTSGWVRVSSTAVRGAGGSSSMQCAWSRTSPSARKRKSVRSC